MERTFICLKATNSILSLGHLIAQFESSGLKLIGMKMFNATRTQAAEHYKRHRSKPYFARLISYMASGSVIGMVWEGDDSVKKSRRLLLESACFSDFRNCVDACREIVVRYGSYNVEDAQRKIDIWFSENDLHTNSIIDR